MGEKLFYSNPLFSPTTCCEPKARRRTLSYTKMTYQNKKSEVNRNKKKLKSPKRSSTSGQLSAENSSWAYEQTNVTFGKLLN